MTYQQLQRKWYHGLARAGSKRLWNQNRTFPCEDCSWACNSTTHYHNALAQGSLAQTHQHTQFVSLVGGSREIFRPGNRRSGRPTDPGVFQAPLFSGLVRFSPLLVGRPNPARLRLADSIICCGIPGCDFGVRWISVVVLIINYTYYIRSSILFSELFTVGSQTLLGAIKLQFTIQHILVGRPAGRASLRFGEESSLPSIPQWPLCFEGLP